MEVNRHHPFFRRVYQPLLESDDQKDQALKTQLDLLLLAAARSSAAGACEPAAVGAFLDAWSDALGAYLDQ